MVEVATGMGCSPDGSHGYQAPPADAALSEPTANPSDAVLPELFPFMIQVPRFDPVISCVDFTAENTLHVNTIGIALGFGDILIPALK
ncbi:hypothetical protein ANCCEY_12903 [Ancylostoma ceylanicum]|uniref:Uncharacterized protein n=1 Tax=Ancylostoma ceylanicum TaxID=53326 RepID=A0A0D6L873_9BILA|nr:hypothetical protein ANCCEY_12903 [Ancylostoma ceylanicum]